MKTDDNKNPLLRNLWCPVTIFNGFLELVIPIVTLSSYDSNTISLSRHEQVCLMRLRFERYFSHHRAICNILIPRL